MSFKNMKKFEKAFAISVLSGVCCFSTQVTEEAKAIFNKKPKMPPTSIPGVRSSKIMGTGPGGFTIREVKGVLQDNNDGIAERNMLLASIKTEIGVNRTRVELKNVFTQKSWEVLQYEPDKYKRNFQKRVRSHTHIDNSNDIQVKVNVNLGNGELENMIVKTGGKRHLINVKTGDYDVTDIASKTQTSVKDQSVDSKTQVSSTGKSEGATGTSIQLKTYGDKTEDVTQKTQQTSTGESSGAVSKKKIGEKTLSEEPHRIIREGTSKVNNKKAIEAAYSTGARDIKVLERVMIDYFDGGKRSQGLYSFYNGEDNLNIRVNSAGDITWGKVTKKGGSSLEKTYDSSVINIPKQKIDVKALMEDVYKSKGLDEEVLKNAVRNFDGKIQRTSKEDIHRFVSGENTLTIHTDEHGELSYVGLKFGGELIEVDYPIDEGEFLLKTKTFYKLGFFTAPGTDLFLQKEVFEGTDSKGNKQHFVKNNEGGVDIVVETKEGFFGRVMSSEQQKLFEGIQSTNTLIVKNRDGSDKRVLVEKIDVNGVDTTVAHQLEDGLWRVVEKNQDGSLYLGSVIKYENLSSNIQGKLRSAVKVYEQYGKLVGGIKDIVK